MLGVFLACEYTEDQPNALQRWLVAGTDMTQAGARASKGGEQLCARRADIVRGMRPFSLADAEAKSHCSSPTGRQADHLASRIEQGSSTFADHESPGLHLDITGRPVVPAFALTSQFEGH